MANTFTTDLLRMAITGSFDQYRINYASRDSEVPCPLVSVASDGESLKFAIDFRWSSMIQPYPDYVIRVEIEFQPDGGFHIHKAEGHGDLSDWVDGWFGNDALFTHELAEMCIQDFLEAQADQVVFFDEA